jgi:DNA-binding transcriptional LysR family regulator
MNEYLRTKPFDLYELFLFRLVSQHRSFTRAAKEVGLTQSAITRQIRGLEGKLDVALLERTTRSVRLTPAGEFLFKESARLTGDVESTLQHLRVQYVGAPKEVRVGVSRTVSLAHLPGFFHANLRHQPQVHCRVSSQHSPEILAGLEANELDLGILCAPKSLPPTLRVTHRFPDEFAFIAGRELATDFRSHSATRRARTKWLSLQNWLLMDETTTTGQRLRAWMHRQGLSVEPVMELDSFDLIINIAALGMGVSLVPIRALALYGRKRTIQRLAIRERFTRELVVVMRRHRQVPKHLTQFVANILF